MSLLVLADVCLHKYCINERRYKEQNFSCAPAELSTLIQLGLGHSHNKFIIVLVPYSSVLLVEVLGFKFQSSGQSFVRSTDSAVKLHLNSDEILVLR